MTHGTPTGYAYHGCRCIECTRAQRVRVREYRNRKTNAVLSGRHATTSLEINVIGPATVATSGAMAPRSKP